MALFNNMPYLSSGPVQGMTSLSLLLWRSSEILVLGSVVGYDGQFRPHPETFLFAL